MQKDLLLQIESSRNRQAGLIAAAAALDSDGTKVQRQVTVAKKPRRRANGSRNTNRWTPKPENREPVLAALNSHGGPLSVMELKEMSGSSRHVAQATVRWGLENQLIRKSGRTKLGGGALYSPMPQS
jgi:hypothetical protein